MTVQQQQHPADEVQAALAKGLLSADAGRRVGWAKFFSTEERVGVLEEQIRELTDERKHLRRAYSRLLGVVTTIHVARTKALDSELASHLAAERLFRHDDAFEAGVSIGSEHRALVEPEHESQQLRRFSRRRRKVAMWTEIYAAAPGHICRFREPRADQPADHFELGCTCGMPVEIYPTRRDATKARAEHLVQAGFGMSADDFEDQFKSRWVDPVPCACACHETSEVAK